MKHQNLELKEVEARALEESNKYVAYCDLAEAKIAELEAKLAIAVDAIEKGISTGLCEYEYRKFLSEPTHYLNEALTKIKGE